MDWGLGTIIDSNRYGVDTVPYGYGKHSSPTTFGHGGSQSSVGFADPERKLVVAVVFNGMPGEAQARHPHARAAGRALRGFGARLGSTLYLPVSVQGDYEDS